MIREILSSEWDMHLADAQRACLEYGTGARCRINLKSYIINVISAVDCKH